MSGGPLCRCGLPITEGHALQERFWRYVDTSTGPDACWPWIGSRTVKGYGQSSLHSRGERANRLAWVLANGPIPKGMHVLHSCDNPPCVNPAHLWLGTNADNIADRMAKGRSYKYRRSNPLRQSAMGSPAARVAPRHGRQAVEPIADVPRGSSASQPGAD